MFGMGPTLSGQSKFFSGGRRGLSKAGSGARGLSRLQHAGRMPVDDVVDSHDLADVHHVVRLVDAMNRNPPGPTRVSFPF